MCVGGGRRGTGERALITLRTAPVQATASTVVPKLPEAGVHRPLTQLGVGLEAGGKFGIINWPRCGAEALIGKALGPPP